MEVASGMPPSVAEIIEAEFNRLRQRALEIDTSVESLRREREQITSQLEGLNRYLLTIKREDEGGTLVGLLSGREGDAGLEEGAPEKRQERAEGLRPAGLSRGSGLFLRQDMTVAEAAYQLLQHHYPRALHYKEILTRMSEAGYHVSGKSPAANLYSQIYRDERFKKIKPGTYTVRVAAE